MGDAIRICNHNVALQTHTDRVKCSCMNVIRRGMVSEGTSPSEEDVEGGCRFDVSEESPNCPLGTNVDWNTNDCSVSKSKYTGAEDSVQSRKKYHGVTISFQGVTVDVGRGKRAKTILSNVSGLVGAEMLTALMGPSGSGKTTLVDVITNRKNTGRRRGVVLYDGEKPKRSFLRYNVAYVQQEDSLIPNLTVEETFLYNLDLTMGRFLKDRRDIVNGMLADLSLEGCRKLMIGSAFQRGISGGQRKRVSIGISLLGCPSILFLDEPTSGLDSFTAFETMSLVKSFVLKGLTVVSSIHAPNSSIFALFDTLMIVLDGHMVYSGPAQAAVEFFQMYGYDGPGDASPADWLTSIVVQASRMHRSEEFANNYLKSELYVNTVTMLSDVKALGRVARQSSKVKIRKQHRCAWILEKSGIYATICIIRHRLKADYRMIDYTMPRILEKAMFAVIIMTLYWGIGKPVDDESLSLDESLANPLQINTALFMWGLLPAFGTVSVIPSIVNERRVFDTERRSGYYGAGAYLFSKVMQEALLACGLSALLALAVWFGLSLSGSWVLFWLVYFVTTMVGVVLAYSCAAIAPNAEYGIIMCAGMNIILIFFVGILIRWRDIPSYWKWIVYVNHLHYSWAALVKNQFTTTETVLGIPLLEYFDLDNSLSSWDYLGYEVIFIVVYFCSGVLGLQLINYGRR